MPVGAVQVVGAFAGSPPAQAFHVETIVDPFTLENVVGMVRHPGHPFIVSSVGWTASYEAQCHLIGLAYLDALQAALPPGTPALVHPDIRAALVQPRPANDRCFGWLPVTWPRANPSEAARPIGSYWARRTDAGDATGAPALMVLVAGAVDTDHQLQAGSDMGLRIILHVHPTEIRIHGITLSGLASRRALEAVPEPGRGDPDIFNLVRRARKVIGRALDCNDQVWISNLEKSCLPEAPDRLFATGLALRFPKFNEVDPQATGGPAPPLARARTFDFRVELARTPGDDLAFVRIHRDNYIGAGATLSCFVQDAASYDLADPPVDLHDRAATRDETSLAGFRNAIDAALAQDDALRYTSTVDCFETWASSDRSAARLGGRTVSSKAGVVVATAAAADDPPVRSDQQAAHDAHLRSADFFGRLQAYGLDAQEYFRFARLPLVHRIRPAMRWAPDGELPSAEVRPFLTDPQAWMSDPQERKASDTLQLLLNYGSADPWHRHKLPLAAGPTLNAQVPSHRLKAQYLSVASDPRWAWHEFGHVMNFACTGELEFPFAHSAGDALAAIACDPTSQLARYDAPDAGLRHVTYPWIQVPGRSHGRLPSQGYGWCGCRNLTRLNFTASLERYRHSYFAEQLLSSSLFRLYRSLGGDTRGPGGPVGTACPSDEATRQSASDYCIYLIMRGISLLGPDTLAPARTADQFVSTLIECDLGTGPWTLIDATWPFNRDPRPPVRRQGGRVHKVIRWAFEQQGLYATDDPRQVSETVGQAPAVDVFIPDRRPASGAPGDGGYAPVPLRTGDAQPWHAHAQGLSRQGARLTIGLGNRGHQADPAPTSLRVWVRADGHLGWQALPGLPAPVQVPGQGGAAHISVSLPPDLASVSPLWVLACADTPADPANLPWDATPPTADDALLEWVAHDNNLALARL